MATGWLVCDSDLAAATIDGPNVDPGFSAYPGSRRAKTATPGTSLDETFLWVDPNPPHATSHETSAYPVWLVKKFACQAVLQQIYADDIAGHAHARLVEVSFDLSADVAGGDGPPIAAIESGAVTGVPVRRLDVVRELDETEIRASAA